MATQASPKAVMGMASRSMLVRLSDYVIRILGSLYGRAQTNSRPPRHPSPVNRLRGHALQLALFGIFPAGMGSGKNRKKVGETLRLTESHVRPASPV